MKLGKKILSTILAITMIITSVSVCFSSLAADSYGETLVNTINAHYAGLAQSLKDGDVDIDSGVVTIAPDTYESGWYSVAKAYAKYVFEGTDGVKVGTVYDTYLAVLEKIDECKNYYTDVDYAQILEVFAFGDKTTGNYSNAGTKFVITVGSGYDILAWDSIAEMAAGADRDYYRTEMTFSMEGDAGVYTLGDYSVNANFDGYDPDNEANKTIVAGLADAMQDIVDLYVDWAAGNASTTDAEILGVSFNAFETIAPSTGATATELWDQYIKAEVGGVSFEDAKRRVDESINRDKIQAVVDQYKQPILDLLDDYDEMKSAYDAGTGDMNALVKDNDGNVSEGNLAALYKQVADLVVALNADDYAVSAQNLMGDVWTDIVDRVEKMELMLSRRYAAFYADTLAELLNRVVPTYDKGDEAAVEAWLAEDSKDRLAAEAWIIEAQSLLINLETRVADLDGTQYIYWENEDLEENPYAHVEDNKYAQGSAYADDATKFNRVNKNAVDALLTKIDTVSLDTEAGNWAGVKTKLDNLMADTLINPMTLDGIKAHFNEFHALYSQANALKKSAETNAGDETIFRLIFGDPVDALDAYEAWLFALTDHAAKKAYEQYLTLYKYWEHDGLDNQAGTPDKPGVTFYNYEAIISYYEFAYEGPDTTRWLNTVLQWFAPTDENWTIAKLTEQNDLILAEAYNPALQFESGVKVLRSASAERPDKAVLQQLFSTGKNGYIYQSGIVNLDWRIVTDYVNNVAVIMQNGMPTTKSDEDVKALLGAAVEALDNMLSSEDLGIVLDSIMASGATTGGLGKAAYTFTYTNHNGQKVTRQAGTEIETLIEWILNMLYKLLYGGVLQNFLITLPQMLGDVIYPLIKDYVEGYIYNSPEIIFNAINGTLPLMPHMFAKQQTAANNGDEVGDEYYSDRWYKFFSGGWTAPDGNKYSYPKVADYFNQYRAANVKSGVVAEGALVLLSWVSFNPHNSYWTAEKNAAVGAKGPTFSTADWGATFNEDGTVKDYGYWNIQDQDDFIRALNASTCGLNYALYALLTGKTINIPAQMGVLDAKATLSTADQGYLSIYDNLVMPLFNLLGITPKYTPKQLITTVEGKGIGNLKDSSDTSLDQNEITASWYIWDAIFSPIFDWLTNTLAANPVATIVDLLPNLLAALEYDQILSKVENCGLHLSIKSAGIGSAQININMEVTGLKFGDIFGDLFEPMGLVFDQGLQGLLTGGALGVAPKMSGQWLTGLLGVYRTKSVSGFDSKTGKAKIGDTEVSYLLQQTEKEVTVDGVTSVQKTTNFGTEDNPEYRLYKSEDGWYYRAGLLSQTIGGLVGLDTYLNFIEWYKRADLTGSTGTGNEYVYGKFALDIPVNRLISQGSVTYGGTHNGYSYTYKDNNDATQKSYHIIVDDGALLLTLFRWLMDDGFINQIKPLLNPLLISDTDGDGDLSDEVSILDTIGGGLAGIGDYVAGILIALLNEYLIEYIPYQDPMTSYIDDTNPEDGLDDGIAGLWQSTGGFSVNEYLRQYLGINNLSAEENAETYNAIVADSATYTANNKFNAEDASIIAQADLAVANLDKMIGGAIPVVLDLLGPMLGDLLGGIQINGQSLLPADFVEHMFDGVESLEDVFTKIVLNKDLFDVLMNLLLGDEDSDGLISGLLGGGANSGTEDPDAVPQVTILDQLFEALKNLGIDITVGGFYRSLFGPLSNTGDHKAGSFSTDYYAYNENVAKFWELNADHFNGGVVSTSTNVATRAKAYIDVLDQMTLADLYAPTYEEGFQWFDYDGATAEEKFNSLIDTLLSFLTPLNGIFGFLLSGQDITLLNALTLQGAKGYSRAIAPIFEALNLGLTWGDTNNDGVVSQAEYDAYYIATPSSASQRLAIYKESPLKEVLYTISGLLFGSEGFINMPISTIVNLLPNLFYALYSYPEFEWVWNGTTWYQEPVMATDAFGNEIGQARTNNLAAAVKNLIRPVSEILENVDPVLSRFINLNLDELLDEFLNLENALNDAVGGLFSSAAARKSQTIGGTTYNEYTYKDVLGDTVTVYVALDATTGEELIDVAFYSLVNGTMRPTTVPVGTQLKAEYESELRIFDFASLAATSAFVYEQKLSARPANPGSADSDTSTFTYFTSSPGMVLITLFRSILSTEALDSIASMLLTTLTKEGTMDELSEEEYKRYENIINGIVGRLTEVVKTAEGAPKGQRVDLVTSILISLLTDYMVDDPYAYFYELQGNPAVGGSMSNDWKEKYAMEHTGHDWESTEEYFTKDKVEDAISNLDYVIANAVPGVLTSLVDNNVLSMDLFEGVELSEDAVLMDLLEDVVMKNVLTDDIMTVICSAIARTFGGLGSTGDIIFGLLGELGYDVSAEGYLFNDNGSQTPFYSFLSYGYDSITLNADGSVTAKIGGKDAEVTWAQVAENHRKLTVDGETYDVLMFNDEGQVQYIGANNNNVYVNTQVQAVDKDGNPVVDEDGKAVMAVDTEGNPVYTVQLDEIPSQNVIRIPAYTKTVAVSYDPVTGEKIETVTYEAVKYTDWTVTFDADDKAVYTPVEKTAYKVINPDNLSEDDEAYLELIGMEIPEAVNAGWDWGLAAAGDTFEAKKAKFVEILWTMIQPLEPIFRFLLLGEDLVFFDGLRIVGINGYQTVVLPLLRAFGLEEAIDNIPAEDSDRFLNVYPGETEARAYDHLMTFEEYKGYCEDYGMGVAMEEIVDQILLLVRLVATYPVSTLATAIPTLVYFILGDGAVSLIENLLLGLTTLTNRLQEIVSIRINTIGAGLIEALAMSDWTNFQNALMSYTGFNEDGTLMDEATNVVELNLTDTILKVLAGIEFQLKAATETEAAVMAGIYSFTETYSADQEAWLVQDAIQGLDAEEDADEIAKISKDVKQTYRAEHIKELLKQIAGLGDDTADDSEGDGYVDISATGQVSVSPAEFFIWLMKFLTNNTTIINLLGDLLGYDLSYTEGASREDMFTGKEGDELSPLLDEILTMAIENPEGLVDLLVSIFTDYEVDKVTPVSFTASSIGETHYPFAENEAEGDEIDLSGTISRVQVALATDNLNLVINNVLDMLRDMLTGEEGLLKDVEFAADEEVTLKNLINKLISAYLYDNESINDIFAMLVELLGGGEEDESNIVGVVLDILADSGMNLTPQSVLAAAEATLTADYAAKALKNFKDLIGDSTKWSEIVKKTEFIGPSEENVNVVYNKVTPGTNEDGSDATKVDKYTFEVLTYKLPVLDAEGNQEVDADGNNVFTEPVTVWKNGDKYYAAVGVQDGEEAGVHFATADPFATEVTIPEGAVIENVKEELQNQFVLNFDWGFEAGITKEAMDANKALLSDILWTLLSNLRPVLELIMIGGKLTVFDKIGIKGFEGYAGVFYPLMIALGFDTFKTEAVLRTTVDDLGQTSTTTVIDEEGNTVLRVMTAEELEEYSEDTNGRALLDTVLNIIFALVDALADNPIKAIETLLPGLAYLIDSGALDTIIGNLLKPLTALVVKLDEIFAVDLMGLIKNFLGNLVTENIELLPKKGEGDAADAAAFAAAAAAQDALNTIEGTETDVNNGTDEGTDIDVSDFITPVALDDTATGTDEGEEKEEAETKGLSLMDIIDMLRAENAPTLTIKEILMQILRRVTLNGTQLTTILGGEDIFQRLGSCAWFEGSSMDIVTERAKLEETPTVAHRVADVYTADKETVLLQIFNWIVFSEDIKALLVELLDIDMSEKAPVQKTTELSVTTGEGEEAVTTKTTYNEYKYTVTVDGAETDVIVYKALDAEGNELEGYFTIADGKAAETTVPADATVIAVYLPETFDIATLLPDLLNYIFESPEGVEELLIDLLSWYDLDYADVRFDLGELELDNEIVIDYDKVGVSKEDIEQLPAEVDELISAAIPVLLSVFGGDLGDMMNVEITGTTATEVVNELVAGLLTDEMLNGLIEMLVKAIGSETVSPILDYVKVAGIDLSPAAFANGAKTALGDILTYEEDGETKAYANWAEVEKAYAETVNATEKIKFNEADEAETEVEIWAVEVDAVDENGDVITDDEGNATKTTVTLYKTADGKFYEKKVTPATETVPAKTEYVETEIDTTDAVVTTTKVYTKLYDTKWNVTNVGDVFAILIDILAPLGALMNLVMFEEDLILLDGITITGGDGYDRGLVPIFEMLGIGAIASKYEMLYDIGLAEDGSLDVRAVLDEFLSYLWDAEDNWDNVTGDEVPDGKADGWLNHFLESPFTVLFTLIPNLSFYLYTGELRQAMEQILAPVITLLNNVERAVGIDVVGDILMPLIVPDAKDTSNFLVKAFGTDRIAATKTLEDLFGLFLTAEGLETIIYSLVGDTTIDDEEVEITLPDNLFKTLVEKTSVVTDVRTFRFFGAEYEDGTNAHATYQEWLRLYTEPEDNETQATIEDFEDSDDAVRLIEGVQVDFAATVVYILGDLLFGGEGEGILLPILDGFGVMDDPTVAGIIEGITGDNKYVVLQVLVNYFMHYDVESQVVEYLSFAKVDYDYNLLADTWLGGKRKIRKSLNKLDKGISTLVPTILQMLDTDNIEILKNFAVNDSSTLQDLVDHILGQFVTDEMMNDLLGLLIGLLAENGETIDGLVDIIEMAAGVSLAPVDFLNAIEEASGTSGKFYNFLATAIQGVPQNPVEGEPVARVTWADVGAALGGAYVDFSTYAYTTNLVVVTRDDNSTVTYEAYKYKNAEDADVVVYKLGDSYYASTAANAEALTFADGVPAMTAAETEYTVYQVAGNDTTWYAEVGGDIATVPAGVTPEKVEVIYTVTTGEGEAAVKTEYTTWTYETVDANDTTQTVKHTIYMDGEGKYYKLNGETLEETEVPNDVTPVKSYAGGTKYVLDLNTIFANYWGIDAAVGTEAKIDAFVAPITELIAPLDVVFGLLFKGQDLEILPAESGAGVIDIKAGDGGYEYGLLQLFIGLGFDSLGIDLVSGAEYKADQTLTLSAIVDPIIDFVYELCENPVQTLLTVLGALSYFIASNGLQTVLENILKPVMGLLDVAEPVLGPIINDLIANTLSPILKPIFGKDFATISDITGLAGETGDELAALLNSLISGLIVEKDENGQATQIFQIFKSTFFEDYAAAAINAGTPVDGDDTLYYYWYEKTDAEGNVEIVKISSEEYKLSGETGKIVKQAYMVNSQFDILNINWKVDVVDAYIFLLSYVLSEDVLAVICDLAGIDLDKEGDIVATIIQSVIDTDDPGLVLADILATLLGQYTVTTNDFVGDQIIIEDKTPYAEGPTDAEIEALPGQLDSLILDNLGTILDIVADFIDLSTAPEMLTDLIDKYTADTMPADQVTIENIVNDLLVDLVYTDELVGSLMGMLVGLLGGENLAGTLATVLPLVKDLAGIDLAPAAFATGDGKIATLIKAVPASDAEAGVTWADVYNYYKATYETTYTVYTYKNAEGEDVTLYELGGVYYAAKGDTEAAVLPEGVTPVVKTEDVLDADGNATGEKLNVTEAYFDLTAAADWIEEGAELESFKAVFAELLTPLAPVVNFLFKGESLKIVEFKEGWYNDEYTAEDVSRPDGGTTSTSDDDLSYALIELKGATLYSDVFVPLFSSMSVFDDHTFKSESALAALDTAGLVDEIFDIIYVLIDAIAAGPIEAILSVLPGLLYFIGSDGISLIANNLLAFVTPLLDAIEPLVSVTDLLNGLLGTEFDSINALVDSYVTADNLVALINGLIPADEEGKKAFELEEGIFLTLAAAMADEATSRPFAAAALEGDKAEDGTRYTKVRGTNVTILRGLLEYVLSDALIGKLLNVDTSKMEDIAVGNGIVSIQLKAIVDNLLAALETPAATQGVLNVLVELFNSYKVGYQVLEGTAPAKVEIGYGTDLKSTEAEVENLVAGLDSIIDQVFAKGIIADLITDEELKANATSIEALIGSFLYTDDLAVMLVELLVPMLAGLETKADGAEKSTMETIDEFLPMISDLIKISGNALTLNLHADAWAGNGAFGSLIGDATTWTAVRDANFTLTTAEDGSESYKLNEGTTFGIDTADELVDFICELIAPLESVLNLIILGGELQVLAVEGEDKTDGISLTFGSMYNYAILPILEGLSVNAPAAKDATLRTVLTAILGSSANDTVDGLLEKICAAPIATVAQLLTELFYFISIDGLSVAIENLIAPIVKILEAVELIAPVNVTVDITKLDLASLLAPKAEGETTEGEETTATPVDPVVSIAPATETSVNVNLDGDAIIALVEDLVAELLGAEITLDIDGFLAKAIATSAPSKVVTADTAYDYSDPAKTWAPVVTADTADALVALIATILSEENVKAIMGSKLITELDLTSLGDFEPVVKAVLAYLGTDAGSDVGYDVIDLLVALVSGADVELLIADQKQYAAVDPIPYESADLEASRDEVNALFAELDTLIAKVVESGLLSKFDLGIELKGATVKEIVLGLLFGEDALIDVAGLIVPAIVDLFAGMETPNAEGKTTLDTIEPIFGYVKDILGIELTLDIDAWTTGSGAFATLLATVEAGLADGEELTWTAVKTYLDSQMVQATEKNEAGETIGKTNADGTPVMVNGYDFGITDTAGLVDLIADLLAPFNSVIALLMNSDALTAFADGEFAGLNIKLGHAYNYAIVPLLEAFGVTNIPTADSIKGGAYEGEYIRAILSALIGYVENVVLATPLSSVVNLLGNLVNFIASNGLTVVITNLIAPINALIKVIADIVPVSAEIDLDKLDIASLLAPEAEGEEATTEAEPIIKVSADGKTLTILDGVVAINLCDKAVATGIALDLSDAKLEKIITDLINSLLKLEDAVVLLNAIGRFP